MTAWVRSILTVESDEKIFFVMHYARLKENMSAMYNYNKIRTALQKPNLPRQAVLAALEKGAGLAREAVRNCWCRARFVHYQAIQKGPEDCELHW